MSEYNLPLPSTVEVIANAIHEAQRGARLRLASPASLAATVRAALDRVDLMATALGVPTADLEPSGTFYQSDKHIEDQVVTLVRVSRYGIKVERRAPGSGDGNGSLRLRLEPPK